MWHAWERRKKCIQILVLKPEAMLMLGRSRHRWEDNIEKLFVKKLDGRVWKLYFLSQDKDR